MKLIIQPRFVTWNEAKLIAFKAEGRLLTFTEVTRWARRAKIDIDIWLDRSMDDRAQYFDAKRQDIRFKEQQELCLLVMIVGEITDKSKNQDLAQKSDRRSGQGYSKPKVNSINRPFKKW